MNMGVRNGLARCHPIVNANIECNGVEFDHHFLSQSDDKFPEYLLVLIGEIKDAACVNERHNQRMAQ